MKIALFDNLPEGGAKRVVFEQLKFLSQKHLVNYYTNKERSIFPFQSFAHDIKRYPLQPPKLSGATRPLKEAKYLLRLGNTYQQIAADINNSDAQVVLVHPCQQTQAPWVLKFLNKPSLYFIEETLRIVYEPDLFPVPNSLFHKKIYELMRRQVLKRVDLSNISKATKLISSSQYVADQVSKHYQLDSTVIPLGVDTKTFSSAPSMKPKHFLFIGNKEAVNGYPLLKKALKLIKTRVKVEYVTFGKKKFNYSDKQLAKLYQNSYATLCLSVNEPFGLSTLESMACGVPVIAVKEGGYRETVAHKKNGLLIKRDSRQLANAIDLLLSDNQLRQRMGQSGQKRVEARYKWSTHNKKIEQQLKKLISSEQQ